MLSDLQFIKNSFLKSALRRCFNFALRRFPDYALRRFVGYTLIASLLVGPKGFAQGDVGQIASMGGMMGMMILTATGANIVESTKCCIKYTAGPTGPAKGAACDATFATQGGACAMLGLNVAAMAAAFVPIFTSKSAEDGVSAGDFGSGSGGANFNPNIPAYEQLNCPADKCDCSGPDSGLNPLCSPDALKNLSKELANAKSMLESGMLTPADGTSLEDALAGFDNATAMADALANGTIPNVEGVSGTDFAGDPGSGNGNKAGKGGATSVIEGNSGGGLAGFGSDNKIKAGPANRDGLGKTLWNGLLDMVDDESGRSLTIWQRATRRYQGNDGQRAFQLAKIESIRTQKFKITRKDGSAPTKATTPKDKKLAQSPALKKGTTNKASAKPTNKAPTRKPASLGKTH